MDIVENLAGGPPLTRPKGDGEGGMAEIVAGPSGVETALMIPPPESPKVGGGLCAPVMDWPKEGTVEFLVKLKSDGSPESGMAIAGLGAANRWYVYQMKAGESLQWWVGGNNAKKRPDLIGGNSPVGYNDDAWYYVALLYRFADGAPTCELKAYVAALGGADARLSLVANETVDAGVVPAGDEPLKSRVFVGMEASTLEFRWHGGLANIAMYDGWLSEEQLQSHLAALKAP